MPENEAQTAKFDRILGDLTGLPDVKMSRPSTQLDVLPIVGDAVTYVVTTARSEAGFTIFLQIVDAEGRARLVIPPRVSAALYRQRQSLADRSTPASRQRAKKARETAKAKRDREARRKKWAEAHPGKVGVNPFK